MYVNAKKRQNKKNIQVFYIYLCESHRVQGKVKNTQRYVGSIDQEAINERDYSFLEGKDFTDEEMEIVKDKLDTMANDIE